MPLINKAFNGKMNLDDSYYRLPQNDHADALNITRDAQSQSQDIVVSNVNGNFKVNFVLPSGINKVIGRFEDRVRNRIYIYRWNSLNYDTISYYDKSNDTIIKVFENLTDTDGIDITVFDPSFRINHIDIIYRDEGDLISWTEGSTSPKEINVQYLLDGRYPIVKKQFIEAAKRPFLSPPLGVYGNDTTRTANALRRKLFQFTARPVYDDFSKATWSTYSKIPLPIGFYGSDNDIDNSNNNFITITVETGDENCTDIEIAMRQNSGAAWLDFVQIASLNKSQLGIPDNSLYDFLFYNDGIYPPIDPTESTLLFDWLPQKAFAQCLANGNVKVYGAITEGYDNYPVSELDVTITAENVTNIPPDTDPPAMSYTQLTNSFTFTVTGSVPTGTLYKVVVLANIPPPTVIIVAQYTSLASDTIADVTQGMFDYVNTHYASYAQAVGSTTFTINLPAGSSILQTIVVAGSGGGGASISTEKVWMWGANYVTGIVYVDEQNRDMPGVTTFANPVNSDNDFVVTTPEFSEDSGDPQTPVITALVNHLPPAGAVKFYWVRRRQTFGSFLYYETCDFQSDSDYYYFCLANIDQYKLDNTQFIYGGAPITDESRIKVIDSITSSSFNGNGWTQDYQILGTVTKTLTGGTSPDDDRVFIKVKIPMSAPSPAYVVRMLVMIYTPALNPATSEESVFWEWGEAYDIYTMYTIGYLSLVGSFAAGETVTGGTSGATGVTVYVDGTSQMKVDNVVGVFVVGETITGGTSGATATIDTVIGINYHRGKDQDQTALQPARYIWEEGDVYFHKRTMYNSLILPIPHTSDTVSIMDASYSDFFDGEVNDNGRGQAVEVNARQTYFPTLVRFSGAYQSGTNINQTNRFYFEDFDEYNRAFGDIRKLHIRGSYMNVFLKFKVGFVPIELQIIKNVDTESQLIISNRLLNPINYYIGEYGIGDVPESFASNNYADYFIDNGRGVVCRRSQDGITVLSIVYKCNAFFVENLAAYRKDLNNGYALPGQPYTGDPTAYGCFNSYTNKYIVALEEINRYDINANLLFHQDAYTLSFAETRDSTEGFESFLSYKPEMMASLDNTFVSFKSGSLWKHSGQAFCQFYGVQYDSYIKVVFNDAVLVKKTFTVLTEEGNIIWECPEIETNIISHGLLPQQSRLIKQDFKTLEQNYHAGLLRDFNSIKGLYNGYNLRGNYIVMKFQVSDASSFVFLNIISVKYILSYVTTH